MGWCAGQGFGVEVGELVQSSSGGLLPKARREHLVDGMAAFYLFLIFAQITYIQNMRRTVHLNIDGMPLLGSRPRRGDGVGPAGFGICVHHPIIHVHVLIHVLRD